MKNLDPQGSHLEKGVIGTIETGAQKEISTSKLLQAKIAPRDQSLADGRSIGRARCATVRRTLA